MRKVLSTSFFGCSSLAIAAMMLTGTTANAATTHSFASDTNDDGPTFMATPNITAVTDGAADDLSGKVVVDLVSGDPEMSVSDVWFEFNANYVSGTYATTAIIPGVMWQHSALISGTYSFIDVDASGMPEVGGDKAASTIYTVTFDNVLVTSISTSATAIGGTASIIANDEVSNLDLALGANAGVIQIDQDIKDFAFTITNIGNSKTAGWVSGEGSYSATFVPEPASLALLGLGGLALLGRRRKA